MTLDISNERITVRRDDYTVVPGNAGWEIHFNGRTIGLRSKRGEAIHAAIAAANTASRDGLQATVLIGDGEGSAYPVWQSWVDGYCAAL
jgi:hypothetical protein